MADLPKPNTDVEVYLAAVVDRLDAVLAALKPAEPSARPRSKRATKPAE